MRPGMAVVLAVVVALGQISTSTPDTPTPVTLIGSVVPLSARAAWVEVSTSAGYSQYCFRAVPEPAACYRASTSIDATSDGGRHWRRVLRVSGRPLHNEGLLPSLWMQPIDNRSGFVLPWMPGPEGKPLSVALYRTSNGGATWSRSPFPSVQGYVFATGVALVGRNDLWVLVHQGAAMGSEAVSLFRTRDAGTHWQKVACTDFGPTSGPGRCGLHSGMSLGGRKDAAVFTSASTGYIALNSNTGIPTLLQTRDGGLYWQAETSRLPDGLPASNPHGGSFTYVTLYGPRFFGAIGLLPAEGSVCRAQHTASHATYSCSTRLYALVSHDAGRAWPVTRAFPALKRKDLESAVWQFESARVWYAAAGTTIWSTRDGGIRWTSGVMSVPGNLRIVSLAFASPTSGWAIAARIDSYDGIASHTELLRTDDSGRSWQTVSL